MTSYQFLKFMDRGFSQSLTLPLNTAKFLKKVAEVITLEGPSGNQWKVKLSKKAGYIYFTEGWKEFIEAHNVEEGDCLVFSCCGSSHFSVLIFDRSGCERESSYFVKNKNPLLPKGCQSAVDEKTSIFEADYDFRRLSTQFAHCQGIAKHGSTCQSRNIEVHSIKHDPVNLHQRKASIDKLEEILRFFPCRNTIRKEAPYFNKIMAPTHVRQDNAFMGFPGDFSFIHFQLTPQTVKLQYERRIWLVEYKPRMNSRGKKIAGFSGKGWVKFVQDIGLAVGDKCIFVLSDSRRKVMDVNVVRSLNMKL